MYKTLIGIKSCVARAAYLQACLETWVSRSPFDVHTFTGPELGTPDDYLGIPFKLVAMVQWAIEHGYDYFWHADDDTYLQPQYLQDELSWDYWGRKSNNVIDFISGFSVGLSRRAMEIVANSKPERGYDDLLEGQWLLNAGIPITFSSRCILVPKVGGLGRLNMAGLPKNFLAVAELTPKMMRELHQLVVQNRMTGSGKLALPPRLYYLPQDL